MERTIKPKNPNPQKKFQWRDPTTGHFFSAGGILIYDSDGIWVIGEKDSTSAGKGSISYTDMGGKYAYEDGNIFATIARECREETYGLCEIFASTVESLVSKIGSVLVNGHSNKPVYMCLVVSLEELSNNNVFFNLDPKKFEEKRGKVMQENLDVPESYYSPCLLTKIPFSEISKHRLSYRLKRIVKHAFLISSTIRGNGPMKVSKSLDYISEITKTTF